MVGLIEDGDRGSLGLRNLTQPRENPKPAARLRRPSSGAIAPHPEWRKDTPIAN
jgi:hypothetical protein